MRVISHNFRLKIFGRDKFICAYCKKKFKFWELHVDHIYPRSKGGQDIPTNLVTACAKCNLKKSATVLKDPPIVKDIVLDIDDFTDQYQSRFTHVIAVTPEHHNWLKTNYRKEGFRSMAHFLEYIIISRRENNPFKGWKYTAPWRIKGKKVDIERIKQRKQT